MFTLQQVAHTITAQNILFDFPNGCDLDCYVKARDGWSAEQYDQLIRTIKVQIVMAYASQGLPVSDFHIRYKVLNANAYAEKEKGVEDFILGILNNEPNLEED